MRRLPEVWEVDVWNSPSRPEHIPFAIRRFDSPLPSPFHGSLGRLHVLPLPGQRSVWTIAIADLPSGPPTLAPTRR